MGSTNIAKLDEIRGDINSQIDKLAKASGDILAKNDEFYAKISETVSNMGSTNNAKLDEIRGVINSQTDKLAKSNGDILAKNEEFYEKISETVSNMGSTNIAKLDEIRGVINSQTDKLAKSNGDILVKNDEFFEKISETVSNMSRTNIAKLDEIRGVINSQTDKLAKSNGDILVKNDKFYANISETLSKASEKIGKLDGIYEAINSQKDIINDTQKAVEYVISKIGELCDSCESISGDVSAISVSVTAESTNDKKTREVMTALSRELSEYNQKYQANIDMVANKMNDVAKNIMNNYSMMKLIADRITIGV